MNLLGGVRRAGCALTLLSDRPWWYAASSFPRSAHCSCGSPALLSRTFQLRTTPLLWRLVGTDSAPFAIGNPRSRTTAGRGKYAFVCHQSSCISPPSYVFVYIGLDQDRQCLPDVEFTPARFLLPPRALTSVKAQAHQNRFSRAFLLPPRPSLPQPTARS